ncbi:hypothetical protein B0H11DRAFT_2273015 [Mycena galericulata]|nr:hypothetical protein B0H11DRAFT_2273015 [Mycena galericulata]
MAQISPIHDLELGTLDNITTGIETDLVLDGLIPAASPDVAPFKKAHPASSLSVPALHALGDDVPSSPWDRDDPDGPWCEEPLDLAALLRQYPKPHPAARIPMPGRDETRFPPTPWERDNAENPGAVWEEEELTIPTHVTPEALARLGFSEAYIAESRRLNGGGKPFVDSLLRNPNLPTDGPATDCMPASPPRSPDVPLKHQGR